jgi:predicted Zn-dependent protease
VSETPGRLSPAHVAVERALEACGGVQAVVIVEDRSVAEVRFANNTMTTNGVRRDRSTTVIVMPEGVAGRSVGVASRSGVVDVVDLAADAAAAARDATPAGDEAPLVVGTVDPDFADPAEETDLSVFGPLLSDLAGAFGRSVAARRRLAGFASQEFATVYLGSSTGLRRRHAQRTGSMELVARTEDGERSAWVGVGAEGFGGISIPELESRLSERLAWAERRIELPAGRYEVILPPDAVADLVIELEGSMSGRDAEEGGNVFSGPSGGTRLGERLFDLPFSLRSDPAELGIACRPFLATPASSGDLAVFDNGAALSRTDWVDGGVLSRLRYHRARAERSGARFTPPIDNLTLELEGATGGIEELVAGTERGLLLTCLWYIREVDPATLLLTGLTRDGVYLVERGEVVGAVNNFRFNESPLSLLADTIEAGATQRALSREWGEWMNRTTMPPLRVGGFNMSSVSQAS